MSTPSGTSSYDIDVVGNRRTGAHDRLDPACANRLRLATAAIADPERNYCCSYGRRVCGNFTLWHAVIINAAPGAKREDASDDDVDEEMLQRKLIARCSGPHSVVD